MENIKFRALYLKNHDLSGYALLEDGTLVKLQSASGDAVAIVNIALDDQRNKKPTADSLYGKRP